MLAGLDRLIIPLVSLGCLAIMVICSSVLEKYIGTDKRCLYINKNDINKFKDKDKLVETKKEYFVL